MCAPEAKSQLASQDGKSRNANMTMRYIKFVPHIHEHTYKNCAAVHSPAQDRRLAAIVRQLRSPFAWQFENINTSRAGERQITASSAEQQAIDIKHGRAGQRQDLEDRR